MTTSAATLERWTIITSSEPTLIESQRSTPYGVDSDSEDWMITSLLESE